MPVQKGGHYLGDSPGGGPKDNQMTLYSDAEKGQHNGQGNPTSGVGVDRVVSMRRLWNEVDAKAARKKLAGGFFRYLVFITLYLIVIHFQKSAEPSFYLTDAVRMHYAEESFIDVKQGTNTFNDMVTVADFWNWMEGKFLPNTFDVFWSNGDPKDEYFKSAVLDKNRLVSGFRMTQRRSRVNDCLLQQRYNGFFPFCFPNTGGDGRSGPTSKEAFGPYYNNTKYRWYDLPASAGGDGDSGFIVNFDNNLLTATRRVQELKVDRWIDQSTRWVRVDMAMYNPSANLFSHVEFLVEFDNTGKIFPSHRVTTMKTEAYLNATRDYIQIVLEIVVMLCIVMYTVGFFKDLAEHRQLVGNFSSYLTTFWNWVDFAFIFLFFLDFCVWIAILADPVRNNMTLALGPTAAGSTASASSAREISLDRLTVEGQTISLSSMRSKFELYWCLQAFTLMVCLMQFWKFLAVNSYLGTLVETFMVVKTVILQFVIVVVVSNVGFGYMGYCMFGHAMHEFSSFDRSFFTLLATSLGDGITYSELVEVNAQGAPILYAPYVLFHCFVLLNMVVAVVVEGYQVQQSQRVRQVPLWHQLRYGLSRSIPSMRRYIPREDQWRYKGPDTDKIRGWLEDLQLEQASIDLEMTEEELYEKLLDKNVRMEDVQFIFKRFQFCTRPRDPPAPEPAVNDMVRELHRVIKALSDSQSVVQRKLDAIIAGQDM